MKSRFSINIDLRRGSVQPINPTNLLEGRDSILSSFTLSERRSRKRRATHAELNVPNFGNSNELSTEPKKTEPDKFLEIFNALEKDYAHGRAIYRKMCNNTFFEENKELLEKQLDSEAIPCLCKDLTLETFQENEVIYEKDEKSNDKIYLIYKGEVEVLDIVDAGLKIEVKPAGSSQFMRQAARVMSEEKEQAQQRSSFIVKNMNLEDEIIKDPVTKRRSLNIKAINMALGHVPGRVHKTLTSGEYFGSEILDGKEKRQDTVVAKTETNLVVLKRQAFEYVKSRFDREMIQKLYVVQQQLSIPDKKEAEIKNQLFDCLTEKTLPIGEYLFNEGEVSRFFYFLYEGKCEAHKKLKDNSPEVNTPKMKSKDVTVCLIESGTFVGEEALFNRGTGYDYTIKIVSAKAVFLKFDANAFKKVFEKEIMASIKQRYMDKTKKHNEIFENISKEVHKRQSRVFTNINLAKSPTNATPSSFNLNFAMKLDALGVTMQPASPFERDTEALTVSKRNEGPVTLTRRFLPPLNTGFETVMATETEVSNSPAKQIMKIKDQIRPFHHQMVIMKQDISSADKLSPTPRAKLSHGKYMTEVTEGDDMTVKNRIYENLHTFTTTRGDRTDDYLSSIEDFSDAGKGFRRMKEDKIVDNFSKFRLNFATGAEEKRTPAVVPAGKTSNRQSIDSVSGVPKNEVLASSIGKKNMGYKSKSPNRKGIAKTITMINSKIDLEALKSQFKGSPHVSMREYLALYKQAHMQNKFSRNISEFLQTKEVDLIMKKNLRAQKGGQDAKQVYRLGRSVVTEQEQKDMTLLKTPKRGHEHAHLIGSPKIPMKISLTKLSFY